VTTGTVNTTPIAKDNEDLPSNEPAGGGGRKTEGGGDPRRDPRGDPSGDPRGDPEAPPCYLRSQDGVLFWKRVRVEKVEVSTGSPKNIDIFLCTEQADLKKRRRIVLD